MSIISITFFSIAFIIFLSCMNRKSDKFSPIRVFTLIWSIAIGMTDLKFSSFQHEWSLYSWLMLLLGPLSFLLGVFAIDVIRIKSSALAISLIRVKFKMMYINDKPLIIATTFLFIIYSLSFILNSILSGYIPMFEYAPGVTRTQWGVFGIGLFIHTAPVILYLAMQYFLLAKKNSKKNIYFGFIFLITFGSYILLLQRYNLALWLIMSLVLMYYSSEKIKLRNVVLTGGIMVAAINIIQTARFARHIENFLYLTSRMKFPIRYAIFTEPYMYLTMGLENFCRAVDNLTYHSFGFFSLNPILAFSGLKHSLITYFGIEEMPYLISGYNTYPFHWYYYYDFGVVGVFLAPLLLGMIISSIYWNMRTNPTYLSISTYAICVFFMIMSFYLNPLTMLNFVYVIILVFITQLYIEKKQFSVNPLSSQTNDLQN
jgi:oligosaccharide repeat unit polymerase